MFRNVSLGSKLNSKALVIYKMLVKKLVSFSDNNVNHSIFVIKLSFYREKYNFPFKEKINVVYYHEILCWVSLRGATGEFLRGGGGPNFGLI